MSGSIGEMKVEEGDTESDKRRLDRMRTLILVSVVVLVATAFALVCYFGFRDTTEPAEPQIDEEEICRLPIVAGPCEAYFPRWAYDQSQEECIEFIYGGCDGNENNFMTREMCQDECHGQMVDVCELPPEVGSCDGAFERWYASDGHCEMFTYGGCEGNSNNFMTGDDCESRCGDMGGLPPTCVQLQDSVYSMKDVSGIFGTSTLLNDVCPPRRTGDLREEAALPTGHFASTQINIGPSPMRLFPHSATMDERGITYESYTLDRWTDPKRTDEYYQLTPGRDGAPWEKVASLGAGMLQTNSAPDGTPLSTFTGLTGIRVGIEGSGDAEMIDFDIMYANFMYTNEDGSMELPLVRGSAMLTHIFTNANPIITPYCLTSINSEPVSYECPEEETMADEGSIFVEVSCDNDTEILSLIVHTTKRIPRLSDVQWAAASTPEWAASRQMHTCDEEVCSLAEDGMTVNITIDGAAGTMSFAINIINLLVFPMSDYGNWYIQQPSEVVCTSDPSPVTRSSTRMPVWFYGNAVIADAQCLGDTLEEAMVTVTMSSSIPLNNLDEIEYMLIASGNWTGDHTWVPCTPDVCMFTDGGSTVTFALTPPDNISYFAANIHGQFILESEPWNWRRQPKEIRCPWTAKPPQEFTNTDRSFIFELSEPGDLGLTDTRKFVAYFDQMMTVTVNDDGLFEFEPEGGEKFTGTMQLIYGGVGPEGDRSELDRLRNYAGVYPYKPKTRFCVEGDIGYISYDWNKRGGDLYGENANQDLLMVALPHHETQLDPANLIDTPWGFKGHVGDRWVIQEDLPSSRLEPDPAVVERIKGNQEQLDNILAAIEKDVQFETLVADCLAEGAQSYWAGKSAGMVTRLATISRAFGTNHFQDLDESLRQCLDLWLGIIGGLPYENVFRYDTVWGGLTNRGAKENEDVFPWTNFGFVSYADHHFHLGYWMYAIAYYAEHYPEWANKEENRVRITALARDVGNPSKKDVYFPTVRQKDWYFGSSWATGIGGGARQEESASEGINCYHAFSALGAAMNDPVMESVGRLMTATEIHATQYYWTVRDNNRHIFPDPLLKYGVLGRLQEDGIFQYTLNWECEPDQFPQRHACIVGIQIIPITAVSHLYMDQIWAENVYDVCSWAIDPLSAPGGDQISEDLAEPVTTKFGAFCQTIMSKKDAQSNADAVAYTLALGTEDLEPGTGLASNLLFIYESA